MQSFALSNFPLRLIIIDPSPDAIEICKYRWQEVSMNGNDKIDINFQSDYSGLPEKVSLAIISTNSSHRYSVMNSVLKKCACDYIILEKFLFSTEEHYFLASSLINTHPAKVYVNCNRRLLECYKWIHNELRMEKGLIKMAVSGRNWGMGSNSIHFIDLFCYLCDDAIKYCDFIFPDSVKILESKRAGYVEFIGNIFAQSEKGHELNLECNEGVYNDDIIIEIQKGGLHISIYEIRNSIKVKIAVQQREMEFNLLYQSQLTLGCFEELMSTGTSSLTSYMESSVMHIKFLQAVEKIMMHKCYTQEWKIT